MVGLHVLCDCDAWLGFIRVKSVMFSAKLMALYKHNTELLSYSVLILMSSSMMRPRKLVYLQKAFTSDETVLVKQKNSKGSRELMASTQGILSARTQNLTSNNKQRRAGAHNIQTYMTPALPSRKYSKNFAPHTTKRRRHSGSL